MRPDYLVLVVLGVTQGTDDLDHPGVAALVQGDSPRCTATLIAPKLLLTAAHCFDSATKTPLQAVFGSDLNGPKLALSGFKLHPQYSAGTPADDVAVAELETEHEGTPATLASAPVAVGTRVRVVGFGRTSPADASAARRRQGTADISEVTDRDLTVNAAPGLPCTGDSGGPVFADVDGVERLVGVTSVGDSDCAVYSRSVRVDVERATFLDALVQAGTVAPRGCSAAPGGGAVLALALLSRATLRSCRSSTTRCCRRTLPSSASR